MDKRGESTPKKAKAVPSTVKVTASVYRGVIIFIDYFQRGKTINGKYCAMLLQRLTKEIKKKRIWQKIKC